MKKWTLYQFGIFILLCIGLNALGNLLALRYQLPLWMDSFGTVLCAYAAGPVCGSIVGLTSNLLYGMYNHVFTFYGLTSAALGILVGLAAKRGMLNSMFGVMKISSLATFCALAISVPLNLLFTGGSITNLWGEGVRSFLLELNFPPILSSILGQFYMEFLDKTLTLTALFLLIRLIRKLRRMRMGEQAAESADPDEDEEEEEDDDIFTDIHAEVHPVADSAPDRKADAAAQTAADHTTAAENPAAAAAGTAGGTGTETPGPGTRAGTLLSALLLTALLGVFPGTACAREVIGDAAGSSIVDYNNYVQTVYNSTNGLPCGEANDIAQTRDGILWVGTYAGLYRYNGQEFRWMDYDSVRNVNCLYVDHEGRLWIGTNDNGLSISIHERIANVVDVSQGLPSNSVRSIIQSTDGYYYIGTTSSMQILALNSGLKKVNTLREINYAKTIEADQQGHVAAVTADGRLFLLKEGRILSSRQIPGGREVFNCCNFDREGHLLAGTNGHTIYRFDISDGGFQEIDTITCGGLTSLKKFYTLDDGRLMITADNGIGYLDARWNFTPVNTNEFNTSIDNMLIDYQGNLWFTSSRLGLLRMAPSPFRDVYRTVGMEGQVVNTVEQWQGTYYFGTDKGLDAVDSSCRRQIFNALTQKLSGTRIRCMIVDASNHLWICTYGRGLLEVEPDGTEYWYNRENSGIGNRTRLVCQLSDGAILAGGDTGICFIRNHEVLQTIGFSEGLISSMILTAAELPDGRILVGTDGDGIAVLENGAVTKMLTRNDGLSSDIVMRIVPDGTSGGHFIVTSNGLCYMEEDGMIRLLDHFPYFNNYDVWLQNEDTLFVMSSAGLYVLNRDDLLSGRRDVPYTLLDAHQGLDSALTANSWTKSTPNGDLFLPCDDGVFVINTLNYALTIRTYRMLVTAVRLDSDLHQVEGSTDIIVDRGVKKIELFPEIINYSVQDPTLGFFLEGFDSAWFYLPHSALNSIVYTNLPPGSYTFHLAVMDKNHQEILSERTYRIVKNKAVYDYPWFQLYLILLPMTAVAWFTWYIVRIRVQRTLELQEKELELTRRQVQMGNETIFAIARTVDAKDERTSKHSYRVSRYAVQIARALGLSAEECENLRKAALMHDIGKIGIPDRILNKPSRLTEEEYKIMKSHVTRGAAILKDFTLLHHAVDGVLYHHERYDGKGYPSGLKGEEIPLYGRIIGVADAFDAMSANRVYRKQMDFNYVLNEIRKGRGAQFDPHIADVFLQLIEEKQIDLHKLYNIKPNAPAEGTADVPTDAPKSAPSDAPKPPSADTPKDVPADAPKGTPADTPKDLPKDAPKDGGAETGGRA